MCDTAIFAKRELEHLARLALADLVLDTLPYGAHTTATMHYGVPVLRPWARHLPAASPPACSLPPAFRN
jgi:hypothetical protein